MNTVEEQVNYNIILMIGDGMGFEHLKLAQWVELGRDENFSIESFPEKLSVRTNNIYDETTDSAAAGTAMATGQKTVNGYLSVDVNGEALETILEKLEKLNKSTGLITTTPIQHATPASFMAHINDRNLYNIITQQIVEQAEVDILLGGGKGYFSESQLTTMKNRDYQIVTNRTDFMLISNGDILGLFDDYYLPFEDVKNYTFIPTLAEMTEKALDLLSMDHDGFFLMVEGGKIDTAAHSNNKELVVLETIAFIHAVNKALKYVKENSDTVLIVTADHETGDLTVIDENLDNILPVYGNTLEENRTICLTRAGQVHVIFGSTGHTQKLVPFYGYGEAFSEITLEEVIENTAIYDLMYNLTHNQVETPTLQPTPTLTPTPTPPQTSLPPPTTSLPSEILINTEQLGLIINLIIIATATIVVIIITIKKIFMKN